MVITSYIFVTLIFDLGVTFEGKIDASYSQGIRGLMGKQSFNK